MLTHKYCCGLAWHWLLNDKKLIDLIPKRKMPWLFFRKFYGGMTGALFLIFWMSVPFCDLLLTENWDNWDGNYYENGEGEEQYGSWEGN